MPVSSMNGPYTAANINSTLGMAYQFAAQEMLLELQDSAAFSQLGILSLRGDVAGSGTDTLRITDFGNVGFSLPMTALASETDTVAPSPVNLGYETVTIGQFGLAHEETYKGQALSTQQAKMGISLDALKARVPQSWEATLRSRVCTAGASITTAVGSAATQLSVDDHLDLASAYRVTSGNRRPVAVVDGTQIDQLLRSYKTEPAFTTSVDAFASVLGLAETDQQVYSNVGGIGINFLKTNDVVQSGGARQGFAFPPGAMGWAVCSTTPIKVANPQGAIYIDQFGLLIEEIPNGGPQTTRATRATALFGVALGSTRVFTQRRLISII